jgi:hypothetical protein
MSITPVNLTDTFDVWRTRTNQIIVLTDSINSNTTNATTIGNAAFTQANVANARAIAAFGQANTANSTAIAAFTQANTANVRAVAAFEQANSVGGAVTTANNTAVAAFAQANTANSTAIAAFGQANTANIRAVAAFTQANNVGSAVTTANNIAIAAFTQANTANVRAVAAFEKANSSAIAINADVVNATRFIAFTNNTTGNASTINVSSSGLFFNPSTRTLTSNNIFATVSVGVGTAPSGTTGEIRATSDITAYYSSDISLKDNIKVIPNALDKLLNIRGVEFDWSQSYIDERGGEDGYFVRKKDVGIIAQEVEKILPEIVATRDNGIKAVKYEKLIALLIEAIKELNSKIEKK